MLPPAAPCNTILAAPRRGDSEALLLFLRFRQSIGVPMDQFPIIAFATKHFSHAQVERYCLGAPTHMRIGMLKANPIGDTITRGHVQNFEVAIAAGREAF